MQCVEGACRSPNGALGPNRSLEVGTILTRACYRAMLRWIRSHGELLRCRSGIHRYLRSAGIRPWHLALSGMDVLEVTGPRPSQPKSQGQGRALDAISALAEAAFAQDAGSRWPKTVPAAWKPSRVIVERRERRQSARAAARRSCSNSTTPSLPHRRKCVTRSGNLDPHAAPAYLCGLEAGHGRLSRRRRVVWRTKLSLKSPRPQNPMTCNDEHRSLNSTGSSSPWSRIARPQSA